jgi:SAM-dependent methyltransferase
MNLINLISRTSQPNPWAEGDNIPWNEPGFSERMLKEHLSQNHDAASRRFTKIDQHVAWINQELLGGKLTRILDLGCGPGLYSNRLARLGHNCTGIDFSPASITYARQSMAQEKLKCTYSLQDIRQADYGNGYGLVMLIYGEFNVFCPDDAQAILQKTWVALEKGGLLLLEPHTFAAIQEMGSRPVSWSSASSELFSDRPHLLLEESFWHPAAAVATNRYYVIDAATGIVTPYAASYQAYTDEQYRDLLVRCGFTEIRFYPSISGLEDPEQSGFIGLRARKPF